MKQYNYTIFIFLIYTSSPLSLVLAQDSTRTIANQIDQGTQIMIDRSNLNRELIFGGMVVQNPEIDYEIDEGKLYLDPVFRPCVITLVGGLKDTVPARIQLYDQLIEVEMNGKDMQVNHRSLHSITTQNGRQFAAFRRPLLPNTPPPLLELLATYGNQKLYGYRRVELRKPSQQKTSYDAGTYKRRLYREDLIYFISPLKTTQIRKMKELIALLPNEKQSVAQRYAKQERLRNHEEDYIELIFYLNQQPGAR